MQHLFRLLSLILFLLCVPVALAADTIDPAKAKADPDGKLLWYDVRDLGVEGQGWTDLKSPFDRLPAKAEKTVRPAVWGLSRHSAGLCVRFVTDATAIQGRWTLTSDRLAMPHMPATGVSGLDLYVKADGRWQWLGVGQPKEKTNTAQLAGGLPAGKREFLLYLPLYNGVSSVEIGIPKEAKLEKGPERPKERQKPIVFYGTSITQGGCASRPGMVHTAILGRRLDVPIINLGFSGNGKMEKEVVDLIAEIDAAVYVIDCLPNMNAKEVEERTEPLVEALVKAHPKTPVVLVEDRSYANAGVLPGPKQRNADSRAALKKAFDRLVGNKVGGLHYLPGDRQIGEDGEGTVDGSHPTDLGFLRMADEFQKVLEPLVPKNEKKAAIEGYTDRLSYKPGDEVSFHVSCGGAKYDVEIARVGAEREVVWKKTDIAGKELLIPEDASSHGCRWPADWRQFGHSISGADHALSAWGVRRSRRTFKSATASLPWKTRLG